MPAKASDKEQTGGWPRLLVGPRGVWDAEAPSGRHVEDRPRVELVQDTVRGRPGWTDCR